MLGALVVCYSIMPSVQAVAHSRVAIVGAGVAGLRCAQELASAGHNVHVVEASDAVGGRVRSDVVDGFTLDRGFQVFLDYYPEARSALNYDALELQPFVPGAIVRVDEQPPLLIADPLRYPRALLSTVFTPLASLCDKLTLGLTVIGLKLITLEQIMARKERTTEAHLSEELRLSRGLIDRFFRPFLQGIFLSPLSCQSSRMFEFVLRAFVDGGACLPRKGMGEVSEQLARSATAAGAVISLNSPVTSVAIGALANGEPHTLQLGDGSELTCDAMVIAVDQPAAERLLPQDSVGEAKGERAAVASSCLYFAFEGPPPVAEPILVLNGASRLDGRSINNLCFPSVVSDRYAPAGHSIACVSVVGEPTLAEPELVAEVRSQLVAWFGEPAARWRFMRSYVVPHAQPSQLPPNTDDFARPLRLRGDGVGLYICGDHRRTPSLNGALASGREAAACVVEDLVSVSASPSAGLGLEVGTASAS